MKRDWLFSILLTVVTLLLLAGSPTHAVSFAQITVCRDTSVEWLRYRFSGIDWTLDTFHYVALGASQEGDTLIADALLEDNGDGIVFAGEAFVAYHLGGGEWEIIKGTPSTPECGELFEGDAPSISIALESDCAFVEIIDPYGNWHRVTDDSHPDGIVLHYGESLIAGRTQSLDSNDYRAVPTSCY